MLTFKTDSNIIKYLFNGIVMIDLDCQEVTMLDTQVTSFRSLLLFLNLIFITINI